MGKRTIPLAWMVTLLLAVAAFSVGAFAADLIIGTGTTAKVHTSVGRAICRLIQRTNPGTSCEVAAFANLKESEMIKDALSAPLHDGAAKYYKERGWM